MKKQTISGNLLALFCIAIVVLLMQTSIRTPKSHAAEELTPTEDSSPQAQAALSYLVEHDGIPAASLLVTTDHPTEYPYQGRQFQVVTLLDTRSEGEFYKFLVDLITGEVIEDIASIQAAEDNARSQTYGKLEPRLDERLQTMQDTDLVSATFLVVAGLGQSLEESEATANSALAAKYPEAQAAVEKGGKPMDVADPALAASIYSEYIALLDADVAVRVQPLILAMQAQGIIPETSAGLPAVTATLTKKDLLSFELREDVGAIFLADIGEPTDLLNTAIGTDRVPTVWARGYDGTGTKIAILESGNVDFTSPEGSQCPASSNNCFLHPDFDIRWGSGESDHTTLVASAAASNHSTYRGVAPGATMISAGIAPLNYQATINSLAWALSQKAADIVNASFGWCLNGSRIPAVPDWAFDYYARYSRRMIVAGAGNFDTTQDCEYYNVRSPAKGWNVLSVGGSNDAGDTFWDDEMFNFSSYENPVSPHSDHEKPEVTAPGYFITGIIKNGLLSPAETAGTSYSTAQVSGLAALLIHRNPLLRSWPVASRAIIMASAINNIEGPPDIPGLPGEDLKDGAGGVVAAIADTAASVGTIDFFNTTPCSQPCWWGLGITSSNFQVGSFLDRYFVASAGEHIRVAISWWAWADCASVGSCNASQLKTDLDLIIQAPDTTFVDRSNSWDNNYELVDFTAEQSGTYRIRVRKYSDNGENANELGIAWIKDPNVQPNGAVFLATRGELARSRNFYMPTPNWTNVKGGLPLVGSVGITEFVLDPVNPINQAYVAIGNPDQASSGAVWRAYNLDDPIPIWTQVLSETQIKDAINPYVEPDAASVWVKRIQASPVQPGLLFVAVGDDQDRLSVGRSFDHGTTWEWPVGAINQGWTGDRAVGLELSEHYSHRLWVGVGYGSRIKVSQNTGETFSPLSGSFPGNWNPYDIHLPKANNPYDEIIFAIVGEGSPDAEVYRTGNAGLNWSVVTDLITEPTPAILNRYVSSDPGNGQNLHYVSAQCNGGWTFMYSTNGGSDWLTRFSDPTANQQFGSVWGWPTDPNQLLAARQNGTVANGIVAWYSSDGGYAWLNKTGDWWTTIGSYSGGPGSCFGAGAVIIVDASK